MRASNHSHDSVDIPIKNQGHKYGAIHFEDGVWIGANSVIVTNLIIHLEFLLQSTYPFLD